MGLNGNVGNHNSGRKTKKEEIEQAIKEIKQEELIKLANTKVYKQLERLENFAETKDMALPITLKGIIDRKDFTSGGKPIPLLQGIVKDDTNDSVKQTTGTEEKN